MLTFDFYNSTEKTSIHALIGLLRMTLQRGYSVICFTARDTIPTRSKRTRQGEIEIELYGDGSGLEVAFLGYWLVLGVESKRSDLVHSLP
ncbi:MAG: hypothetical protein IV085_10170 [Thiobacillus sp.]|nr:hypothetical protein [Thiobacillus sp.]